MCYYADWKVRVSSSAYRQLRWKVYQDARANLQLNDMGIELFLFVDGQYIVEEVVVGHIGTASCMACGCLDELPRRQIMITDNFTFRFNFFYFLFF